MISINTGNTLLNYLTAQDSSSSDGSDTSTATSASSGTSTSSTSAAVQAKLAATAAAALRTAAGSGKASIAVHALDKQQAALGTDLKAAMARAGVTLGGAVEFSVSSDGKVAITGSDADKAATNAFLKADTSKPGFANRIATQASNALKLSATVQQSAAISQAARFGGRSGVMSMYTSLMQQTSTSAAVFTLPASGSSTGSSLTYPGSLTAKA